ncbi:MAG: hypothetical protein EXR92_00600 [Gemmatimonadetes bacterium]|nr:hypothetical protein [Gemmatimonadota bacterium]
MNKLYYGDKLEEKLKVLESFDASLGAHLSPERVGVGARFWWRFEGGDPRGAVRGRSERLGALARGGFPSPGRGVQVSMRLPGAVQRPEARPEPRTRAVGRAPADSSRTDAGGFVA